MNMYTPSSPYFNPMDVDRYFSHRAKEAIDATLSGTPEKIDGPQFLQDWINLCKLHYEWLRGQGVGEGYISVKRRLAEETIRKKRRKEQAAITAEVSGIASLLGAYEDVFGEIPDVRTASKGQIAVLEALKQSYHRLYLM